MSSRLIKVFLVSAVLTALLVMPGSSGPECAVRPGLARQAKKILALFSHEPSVRSLQKAAMNHSMVSPGRLRSLLGRARHSGWLPEFRFRYNRNVDDDRSTAFPTDTNPILTTQSTDLDHRFEFRFTWSLDELIFNKNEANLYRDLRRLIELREDLLKEVTRLYFARRRMQVDMQLLPPRNLLARVRAELRLQELTANMDAVTGGYLSRRLKAAGKDPYR